MAELIIQNRKIYKGVIANNNKIRPGKSQELPDDCFFYSFIVIKWRAI